jgi:hypothetical protein
MSTNWRISSFTGALLAAYFIPTWAIIAYRIVLSPIHSFYERPNVSLAFFASDYLQLAATGMVRTAWLLALGRLMVVAFFAMFVLLLMRSAIRKTGGWDEALLVALGIGSVICFAMMVMASLVHETEAMRLHATELLMLLGTTIVLMIEGPAKLQAEERTDPLTFAEPQLVHDR